MNNFKLNKIIILALFLFLTLSACSISTSSSNRNKGVDSSLFYSRDGGTSWQEAVALQGETASNIRNVNVISLTMDPQDNLAVYLASRENGLFYTYNIARYGWIKVDSIPNGRVLDVEIDPANKCTIYTAIANRVYKSTDCNRSYESIYYDNNVEVTVNDIAIDHYNPNNIYIGTSRGEIIKSVDAGLSWQTIRRLDDGISQLILSPADSRLVFVSSTRNKIYSFSVNSTPYYASAEEKEASFEVYDWQDLNAVLKDYNLGRTFRAFVVGGDGAMFIATNQAILRSVDRGITWEKLNIIQPEKDAIINSLTVDKQSSLNLYYVTNTTFFKSIDGGETWSMKKLPSNRVGSAILVDHNNPNVLYLGTATLK